MIPGVVDGDAGRREAFFFGFRIDRSLCGEDNDDIDGCQKV